MKSLPSRHVWCVRCRNLIDPDRGYCPYCEQERAISQQVVRCEACGRFILRSSGECPHCGAGQSDAEDDRDEVFFFARFKRPPRSALAAVLALVLLLGSFQLGKGVGTSYGRQLGYDSGYENGLTEGRAYRGEEEKQIGYQQGYANGLSAGFEEGKKAGYNTGYDEGKSAGYRSGTDAGYTAALAYFNSHARSVSGSGGSGGLSSVQAVNLLPPVEADEPIPQGRTVYITKTGAKYHSDGCRYLSRSKIAITLKQAVSQGYTPCSVCHPPR